MLSYYHYHHHHPHLIDNTVGKTVVSPLILDPLGEVLEALCESTYGRRPSTSCGWLVHYELVVLYL
jgi:hypothetical protein